MGWKNTFFIPDCTKYVTNHMITIFILTSKKICLYTNNYVKENLLMYECEINSSDKRVKKNNSNIKKKPGPKKNV